MTLISADELVARLSDTVDTVVLDVRWTLQKPDGREDFLAGHIPGAVYVDLDSELSDHSVPDRGRHPLPGGAAVQDSLRRWGVDDDSTVVVYDDWNRAGSSRAWWVLRAAGLQDVRILDGGWSTWAGEVETGDNTADRWGTATVTVQDLYHGALPTLTADASGDLAGGDGGTLLDARAPERYRGEVEPVDPVAGHIPGAQNLPSTSVLNEDGTFVAPDELRSLLGIDGDGSGAYCGSGVSAAVLVAAASTVGVDVALFPGSWSEWSGAYPTNRATSER
ncbi:MAG TPA: sulfurtransferase [Candidatus Corynebacterium avicola]|uniref:Sulfurtransferase n=1 Tax=Candidatus Corynebacterium avicola TaxID=2838527 RepID=A0A9D1ULT3_9CORY|nr:sulfurtransferase [Candidatus Corynebacterium avicola]